jgi:hypothetical protein
MACATHHGRAAPAAESEAHEIGRTQDADLHRAELLDSGAQRQQGGLQAIAHQQHGDAEKQGCDGREGGDHDGDPVMAIVAGGGS